jgi:hypothetical protein
VGIADEKMFFKTHRSPLVVLQAFDGSVQVPLRGNELDFYSSEVGGGRCL